MHLFIIFSLIFFSNFRPFSIILLVSVFFSLFFFLSISPCFFLSLPSFLLSSFLSLFLYFFCFLLFLRFVFFFLPSPSFLLFSFIFHCFPIFSITFFLPSLLPSYLPSISFFLFFFSNLRHIHKVIVPPRILFSLPSFLAYFLTFLSACFPFSITSTVQHGAIIQTRRANYILYNNPLFFCSVPDTRETSCTMC